MKFLSNKWTLLSILSLTWGSSFILIKQSIEAFTPMQVGALRLSIAGLVLAFFGIRNFKYIPKKLMKWVLIGGCLGNFVPMFLFPLAQQKVSSSMAGILDSLVPIFILIFGFLFFGIKSKWTQMLGALIGFVGAAILVSDDGNGGKNDVFHSLLIVLATLCYALNGLILGKYLSGIQSFKLSSVVFTIWLAPGLIILGITGFYQGFSGTPEQWKGLGFVSILAIFGTAIAMILFYKVIQMTSAIFASVVTYLMPIIAVLWGILEGEEVTWIHAAGGILILLGVDLIQMKSPRVRKEFEDL